MVTSNTDVGGNRDADNNGTDKKDRNSKASIDCRRKPSKDIFHDFEW